MPVLSATCQRAPSLPDVTGSSDFPKPLEPWAALLSFSPGNGLSLAADGHQPHSRPLLHLLLRTPVVLALQSTRTPRPGHASLCLLTSDVPPLPGKLLLTARPVPHSEPSLAQYRPTRLSSPAPCSLDSSFPSTHHLGAMGRWGLAPACLLTTFLCESSGLDKTISSVPQITHVFLIP